MLGNAHIPPRALPDKDRDMLVAFPNPILASSSSISYVIITCQKPKRVPFPHRWQTYFIRDTACTASQQPAYCKQGSYSTSPLACYDCSCTVDTFMFTAEKEAQRLLHAMHLDVLATKEESPYHSVSIFLCLQLHRLQDELIPSYIVWLVVPCGKKEKSFSRQNKNTH